MKNGNDACYTRIIPIFHYFLMQIDQLIRSKRKTIALIIERDGRLTVRAPLRLALRDIQKWVDTKSDWIEQKRALVKVSQPVLPPPKRYAEGEAFLYLGQHYPLTLVASARPALRLADGRFLLAQAALLQAEAVFSAWYREQARRVCSERAAFYAARMGVGYEQIRISSARTRWGSCSSRGTISFTWRLVLAPLEIVDYVVVHELAHRREPNHSSRFWAIVEQFMPDYKKRRDWLKKNAAQLV
jgi:predicted metal-dependent hydrolase